MARRISQVTLVPRPRFPTAAYGLHHRYVSGDVIHTQLLGVWVWVRDQCVCMCVWVCVGVCGCVCDIFQLANYSFNLCYHTSHSRITNMASSDKVM